MATAVAQPTKLEPLDPQPPHENDMSGLEFIQHNIVRKPRLFYDGAKKEVIHIGHAEANSMAYARDQYGRIIDRILPKAIKTRPLPKITSDEPVKDDDETVSPAVQGSPEGAAAEGAGGAAQDDAGLSQLPQKLSHYYVIQEEDDDEKERARRRNKGYRAYIAPPHQEQNRDFRCPFPRRKPKAAKELKRGMKFERKLESKEFKAHLYSNLKRPPMSIKNRSPSPERTLANSPILSPIPRLRQKSLSSEYRDTISQLGHHTIRRFEKNYLSSHDHIENMEKMKEDRMKRLEDTTRAAQDRQMFKLSKFRNIPSRVDSSLRFGPITPRPF